MEDTSFRPTKCWSDASVVKPCNLFKVSRWAFLSAWMVGWGRVLGVGAAASCYRVWWLSLVVLSCVVCSSSSGGGSSAVTKP
jgi:hypothetical protein